MCDIRSYAFVLVIYLVWKDRRRDKYQHNAERRTQAYKSCSYCRYYIPGQYKV